MILTRQMRANSAAHRWGAQYRELFDAYPDKEKIYAKLVALGTNPDIEDVNRAIGKHWWTEVTCRQCKSECEAVAVFNDYDGEAGPIYVCEKFLWAALEGFAK